MVDNLGFGPPISPEEQAQREILRLQFFAAVGQCVTSYQQIEDNLQRVFALALRVSNVVTDAMWEIFGHRGLDMKLAFINAALASHDESTRTQWRSLSNDIKQAQDDRNDIAHATSANSAGLMFHLIHAPAGMPPHDARSNHLLVKQQRSGKPPKTIYDSHLSAYQARLDDLSLRLARFSSLLGESDWSLGDEVDELSDADDR